MDRTWTKTLAAPAAELRERHRVRYAAADGPESGSMGTGPDLTLDQIRQVCRMERIAHLIARAAEAVKAQGRPAAQARTQYEKIPCSGVPNCPAPASTPQRSMTTGRSNASPYSTAMASDASLVAPYSETGPAVENDSVIPAGEAPAGHSAAVSGTNARSPATSGNAVKARTLWTRLVESSTSPAPRALQYLEDVDRTDQIVLDDLTAGRPAIDAAKHARVRRGVDHPVGRADALEIARRPDVTVCDGNASGLEPRAIRFAAGPAEIVYADQSRIRQSQGQLKGDLAANKATGAGDDEPHRTDIRSFQVETISRIASRSDVETPTSPDEPVTRHAGALMTSGGTAQWRTNARLESCGSRNGAQ